MLTVVGQQLNSQNIERVLVLAMKDKVVVITGANGGIGTAIADYFHRKGAKLALLDLKFANNKESFSESLCIECDVTDIKNVAMAKDIIVDVYGKIDVLVNCAGILPPVTPLEEIDAHDWKKTIDINLNGTFYCTQVFGKVMLKNDGGSIVNIASMAGLTPSPKREAYSVSKAAVLMLTKQTAIEWGSRKIRANAVCPGYIETPLISHMYKDEKIRKKRERLIPMGRLGRPEEVARVVYFLASPESEYINGEFIKIDGAYTLTTLPNIDSKGNVID